MSRILRRLRSLAALAADSDSPEAQNAASLMDRLTDQYGVSLDDAECIIREWIAVPRGGKRILTRILTSLGITGYTVRGRRGYVLMKATRCQIEAVRELLAYACDIRKDRQAGMADAIRRFRALLKKQQAENRVKLKSFIEGFLDAAFPLGPPKCPECGSTRLQWCEERAGGGFVVCHGCCWRSRKLRRQDWDVEAYHAGQRTARPALKAPEAGTR